MGWRARLGTVAAALWCAGCPAEPPVPGDEAMGHFAFTATELGDGGCTFRVLDGGAPYGFKEFDGGMTFGFEGTFSRNQNGTGAWFTVGAISRPGTWDGQLFEAPYTADRRLDVLRCDNRFTATETLRVVLLSDSQEAHLGRDCPQEVGPLLQPGGVPVDPDGGVLLPDTTLEGFDAARACGLLIEELSPKGDCDYPSCTAVFRVEGVRTR